MGGQKPEDDGEASTVAHLRDQTVPASRDSQTALDLQVGGSIGRYRLDSRIGAGAMGVVWCALDPQLDRRVAIKVLHPNLARSVEASNRLLREARAMAKLSHRAVVTVHDAGEVDGRLFLAMELVDGTTLGQMLRTRTEAERQDWRKWLEMMLAAGRGLEAAHGAGVLHRDFKPDNVLVDTKGRVCVADFGLATLGGDRPQPISERISKLALELTTTGALLGTPAYMSPQQLRGEVIDARADQFNFCVATYEALYGHRPFGSEGQGLEMIESLEASIERGDVWPPPADSAVPTQIHDVLRIGLAADPEQRWRNMAALLAALERAKAIRKTTKHSA
ncbi:MAG: serine/threonine protein kinase, partial [Deltaproteobacteria bacterium]|nr:serine/threonine protein kinase [Deltaproteobacteria bacterium]